MRNWSAVLLVCLLPVNSHDENNQHAFAAKQSVSGARIIESYGKLPLTFEANQGQTDSEVKFVSRGSGYSLFLTSDEAVLSLQKQSRNPKGAITKPGQQQKLGPPASTRGSAWFSAPSVESVAEKPEEEAVLRMKLVGANPTPHVTGLDELPGKSNYFIGNDPAKWRTNVPTYAKVRYENVYTGIDLLYYGNQRQLEYDFVVAPGADPLAIRLAIEGDEKLRIDGQGDLVLKTKGSEVRLHYPVIYQESGGARRQIDGHFVIQGRREVGFEVARYDANKPLIIDPVLSYSTYLGGSAFDTGSGIAVDSSGNAYVAGNTSSTNFPTANAFQSAFGGGAGSFGGGADAFVTKLNATGSALVYSTYLGGSGEDVVSQIAVDSSGNAYVTGNTLSNNFPTAIAFQRAFGGGSAPFGGDAFVTKLNATGSALVYSTYLGGRGDDSGSGIAVDLSGNAYVTGNTLSSNFPTANAFQAAYGGRSSQLFGGGDAFVTKLNAEGSALVYSTYLGGNGDDVGGGVAVDSSGNAYVTGSTSSTNFPTEKAFQAAYGGRSSSSSAGSNVFVTKLNAAGSALVYSTYLGGSAFDRGYGIAVDSSGSAYVTGRTTSPNFPTANAFQAANGSPDRDDAFVTKFNAAGSALVYSTHLGGNGNDEGDGLAVDSLGNAYVTGTTSSTNFPTANALQAAYGGRSSQSSDGSNAFVTKLNAAGLALVYSTYLGGRSFDRGNRIAVDSSGNAYVTGYATSPNFPTANALQGTFRGGDSDGFLLKITDEPVAPPPPQPPPQPPPPAPIPSVTTVSAASFAQGAALAPGAIGSAFGSGLAAGTQVASTVPLPTSLGGTSVRVRDSSGAELPAPLFFVSAGQINYLVPENARTGTATVTVLNDGRTVAQGTLQIDTFAPALFTANANGSGVPAALAIRAAADGAQTTPPVFDCSAGPGRCVPAALDLGAPSDQVVLLLFGSGIRGTAGLPTARVIVAGADMEVLYAGPQGSFVGLDQVNVWLSRSLVGRGEVDVVVTVGGKTANTVRIRVQ